MKKIVLTATAFAAFAGPAFAADLPQREYAKAPAVMAAPIYDWTGFFIGGNAGYGSSRNCWGNFGTSIVPEGCNSRSGGMIGGQAATAGKWVRLCSASKLRVIGPTCAAPSPAFSFRSGPILPRSPASVFLRVDHACG